MNPENTLNSSPDSKPGKTAGNNGSKWVNLYNNAEGYGIVAVALHWSFVIVVTGLFALGVWMTSLDYYHEWYKRGPDLHRSIGVLLFMLLLFRVYWRISNPLPEPEPCTPTWQNRIAHWVHLGMYLLLFTMVISGYLISTADGRGVDVFGMFQVPALIELNIENLEDRAGEVHWYLALTLAVMAGIHALAALKHHFIDRDRTLVKMLGKRSPN